MLSINILLNQSRCLTLVYLQSFCKFCDGKACAGEIPGVGGRSTGSSFKANYTSLTNHKLNLRTMQNSEPPSSRVVIFGKEMDMPVFAAPVTGVHLNNVKEIEDNDYMNWIIEGCLNQKIYPMVGNTPKGDSLMLNLEEMKKSNLTGIAFIKPWDNKNLIKK